MGSPQCGEGENRQNISQFGNSARLEPSRAILPRAGGRSVKYTHRFCRYIARQTPSRPSHSPPPLCPRPLSLPNLTVTIAIHSHIRITHGSYPQAHWYPLTTLTDPLPLPSALSLSFTSSSPSRNIPVKSRKKEDSHRHCQRFGTSWNFPPQGSSSNPKCFPPLPQAG
ncbi:hypothetical protein E2C01_057159 [Portunus trituberculatus]|uniref:Uncharacterized protein n=1 Tax=Portunus trituberculatus TaxID=210409 RepID=A0A5B7H133_PORTR|nr:hypothetical protein [Portunus trituberculatus]